MGTMTRARKIRASYRKQAMRNKAARAKVQPIGGGSGGG
jgi:hypothetical protein